MIGKCEVCSDTDTEVFVASIPAVPCSAAYCQKCLSANAHPYQILVINTNILGGLEHAADFWKDMVTDTLIHLGKSRQEFLEDVKKIDEMEPPEL